MQFQVKLTPSKKILCPVWKNHSKTKSSFLYRTRRQNYARPTTRFVPNTATRTSTFWSQFVKMEHLSTLRNLVTRTTSGLSHGKLAHKTGSQNKKFANIIAIDKHSEKVSTENNYMPGFSIGYQESRPAPLDHGTIVSGHGNQLDLSPFLDSGLGTHTLLCYFQCQGVLAQAR